MISAISVKDRLKNQAKEDGRTMQDELVTYGLERAIYRLSISEYAERFTLKGGIFLYALFDGNFARATMDIDLLAQHMSNDAEEMKKANYNMDGNELKNAIIETFTHRETGFDDIVAFESDFKEDSVRQGRWRAFIKKKKAMMKVEFAEAIEQSKKLLMPIVEAIEQNQEFNRQWNKDSQDWV